MYSALLRKQRPLQSIILLSSRGTRDLIKMIITVRGKRRHFKKFGSCAHKSEEAGGQSISEVANLSRKTLS
jgi:hypothetical protein